MAKHFIINPKTEKIDKADIVNIQLAEELIHKSADDVRKRANTLKLSQKEDLVFVHGRVIVKVDLENKNSHRFEDGTEIRLERKYNNFNRRETEPVNCIVVSAEYIPSGVEILVSHNSLHDTNRIFDYPQLSGAAEQTDVRYYSLPEDDCFAWRDENGVIKPMKNFEFGLRVFRPYTGSLTGIEPELIKDVLYVTTGGLSGNVVNVLKASDYQIVFQGKNGREDNLIRFRHSDNDDLEREEVICINHTLTEDVLNGRLLIGITVSDAKLVVLCN